MVILHISIPVLTKATILLLHELNKNLTISPIQWSPTDKKEWLNMCYQVYFGHTCMQKDMENYVHKIVSDELVYMLL